MSNFTFDTELFSDLHKDTYGFRPRGHEFFEASDERKQEIWDQMIKNLEEELILEKEMDVKREEDFDALVKSTIESGAGDEDTAVRWLLEAGEVEPEYTAGDYVAYVYGLKYDSKWISVFNRVLKEMRV